MIPEGMGEGGLHPKDDSKNEWTSSRLFSQTHMADLRQSHLVVVWRDTIVSRTLLSSLPRTYHKKNKQQCLIDVLQYV
jgi:hypothetical protein